MLKVKVIRTLSNNRRVSSKFSSFEILTNSPEKFEKWCRKNFVYARMAIKNRSRPDRINLTYPGTDLVYVKMLYTGKFDYNILVKKWGYFDKEYDPLSTFDKIKFKIDKHFGKVTPLMVWFCSSTG